jgi:hypothetical protein
MMKQANKLFTVAVLLLMSISITLAQNPAKQSKHPAQPQATSNPVTGSGTTGRLTKWTSPATLGDSVVFEDKFGKIGIGTITPTSPLTIQGMVETTLGGYKFPDGTVQTTAALSSVFHDATLKGNGTSAQPLGIAVPLTLKGTGQSTLGPVGVLNVFNTGAANTSAGIYSSGLDEDGGSRFAGTGVIAVGGSGSDEAFGGTGVRAGGGKSEGGIGGDGVSAIGGTGNSGGAGVSAIGGRADLSFGGIGVVGQGGTGTGTGFSGGDGVAGFSGVGLNGATYGKAGLFGGDVEIFKVNNTGGNLKVAGNLNVSGTKNFKIDHPLDPENKYLVHAAIESSEVLNVYSGNVTTDANGDAVVQLPDWFEAINRDFRYQLTVIGSFNQAIVAGKIKNNAFAIKTNGPGVEVSWQVTGVRNDAVMKAYPFKVEEAKAEPERGYYLSPDAYNLSEEKGIEYVRNPELMRRVKEAREKAQKEKLQ